MKSSLTRTRGKYLLLLLLSLFFYLNRELKKVDTEFILPDTRARNFTTNRTPMSRPTESGKYVIFDHIECKMIEVSREEWEETLQEWDESWRT